MDKEQQKNIQNQRIKNIYTIIQKNDVKLLHQYLKNEELNMYNFLFDGDTVKYDILLYSIQNNASLEIINAILPLYKSIVSHYNQNVLSSLVTSIINNKFEIANLILENNSDILLNIDFKERKGNILEYILSDYQIEKKLNEKNLKYILNWFIEKNTIPIIFSPNKFISSRWYDIKFIKIIITYYLEKQNFIDKEILYNLYKNIIKINTYINTSSSSFFYDDYFIPYNDVVNQSTILFIKNCHNNEEEENIIFDIFWEEYKIVVKINYNITNKKTIDEYMKNQVINEYVNDIFLKKKFSRYIDNKLIPEETIIERKKKIEILKNLTTKTINDVIPKLNTGSDNFDALILAIENNLSDDIIIAIAFYYIVKDNTYSINKIIKKEYYSDGYQCRYNTSLFSALANNNFPVTFYLLEWGAIPYNKINIIKYLYFEERINIENFEYLLSYKLVNDDKRERDYIIIKWIETYENIFLEMYLQGYINVNNFEIDYIYFEKALTSRNYNAIIILFHNDRQGKYHFFKLISKNNGKKILELMSKYEGDSNFKDENFCVNNKDCQENKRLNLSLYINESIYRSIKSEIISIIKLYQSWKPETDLPAKENKNEMKTYLMKNKETIKKFNEIGYNFDLLIFAIENNFSIDMIEFIITNFSYKTLNYGIEKNSHIRRPKCNTPLLMALIKNNFEIANYLLDHGASINYQVNTIKFLKSLNPKNLIYLFDKGYVVTEKEDSYFMINTWIEERRNIILEIYLVYSKIKNIRSEYYFMAMEYQNIDALIILYEHDVKPKEIILEKIFSIYKLNFRYYIIDTLFSDLNKNSKKKIIIIIKLKKQAAMIQRVQCILGTFLSTKKNTLN